MTDYASQLTPEKAKQSRNRVFRITEYNDLSDGDGGCGEPLARLSPKRTGVLAQLFARDEDPADEHLRLRRSRSNTASRTPTKRKTPVRSS
ncbi:MAG: hypothetical protein MZU97_00640 [Bacillus subtilis]|nr:hypothetical protein [Bacillus subtilis]